MRRLLPFLMLLSVHTLTAQSITLQPFAEGFFLPVDLMQSTPEDDRLFVVEKPGRIDIARPDGTVLPTPFLNIIDQVNDTGGEMGLLGLEFSPNYTQDGYFFTNYTNTDGDTRISRWSVDVANPDRADLTSEVILLEFDQPYSNHNAGDLAFGPDGYLYVSTGDGGLGGDPQNNSQNRSNFLGKILRLDVLSDPAAGYVIPSDNPFVNDPTTLDEFWAIGLRNPWRVSFDSETGDLWIADVGQNAFEEVNFQPAGSPGGQNYGWRCYEGDATFNTGGCPPASELTFPVHTYQTSGTNPGCSVTGGYVYRGCDFPALYGKYIYSDFCSGRFWSLTPDGNGGFANAELLNAANYEFGALGVYQGELYAVSHNEGTVYRLIAEGGPLDIEAEINQESCTDAADGAIQLGLSQDVPNATYSWSDGSTAASRTGLTSGPYSLTVTYNGGCTLVADFEIVPISPAVPTIEQDQTLLSVPTGYTSYQWYLNGEAITGATSSEWTATESGTYTVEVIDEAGCVLLTPELTVTVVSTLDIGGFAKLRVSPNPFEDVLRLEAEVRQPLRVKLRLLDATGKVWHKQVLRWTGTIKENLALPEIPAGVYWLEVESKAGRQAVRVIRR